MTLKKTIEAILSSAGTALTPQQIREIIKDEFPELYGTPSHQRNVQRGHYSNLDHALLAQIYSVVRQKRNFMCDTSYKPMRISISPSGAGLKRDVPIIVTASPNANSDKLISDLRYYYQKSLEVLNDFGGPSVYFHVQSIKEQSINFLSDRHIEMVYATLASWGMHKMGDPKLTKAKLVNYSAFKSSILIHEEELRALSSLKIESCTEAEYADYIDLLEKIYYNLKVSISKATVVANSKTLAHILPNLIPPIDRQYTIRFFTQHNSNFFTKGGGYRPVSIPENIHAQFLIFKDICCKIKHIYERCDKELLIVDIDSFSSSIPKIMDNLIIAFVKESAKSRVIQKKP